MEADVNYKIIRDYKVTDASVHDSNVFEELLDESNTSRDVYADSAYRSAKSEANLKEGQIPGASAEKRMQRTSVDLMGETMAPDKSRDAFQNRTYIRGYDTASRKSHSEVHRDKQGGSEVGITQHRIQHGEILLFDEADRIKEVFRRKNK